MNSMLRNCNEKEIDRLLEFIPGILEEAVNITSFYKSQARINNLYKRAKKITKTTYTKYPTKVIENEFSKTREELDKIYDMIVNE